MINYLQLSVINSLNWTSQTTSLEFKKGHLTVQVRVKDNELSVKEITR